MKAPEQVSTESIFHCVNQLIGLPFPLQQKDSADKLFEQLLLLSERSQGIQLSDQEPDTLLNSGKAIGPFRAAVCIKEFLRTRVFFIGILEAVKDFKTNYPDICIHILYAGTGPFATLALPLIKEYSPADLRFTLIDIHQSSLDIVRNIFTALEVWDYVEEVICADASTIQLSHPEKYHLVLCETMQRALEKEPQFNITLNLTKQLDPDVIWIPESIRVDAVLQNPANEINNMMAEATEALPVSYKLDTVMLLDKNSVDSFSIFDKLIPVKSIHIPQDKIHSFPELALYTEVCVYHNHRLKNTEASITLPHKIDDLCNMKVPVSGIHFFYSTEGKVGFVWEYR